MMRKAFKILWLGLWLLLCKNIQTSAQQDHFVYIQSDEKTAFDVSVNGQTYNSSSLGYVIIPKLTKGSYQLNISFANKKYPAQQFNCAIDKVDAGFLLKNYTDKGWGLFNLQTSDIIMSGSANVAEIPKVEVKNDAFGNMLSQVSGDTTLNLKTEIEKPVSQKPLPVMDSTAFTKNEIIAEKKESALNETITIDSASMTDLSVTKPDELRVFPVAGIIKINEFSNNDGTDVVFVDTTSGLNDTIRIFLPAQPAITDVATREIKAEENKPVLDIAKNDSVQLLYADTSAEIKQPIVSNSGNGVVNNPFFTKEEQGSVDTNSGIDSIANSSNEQGINKASISNPQSDCKNSLSENDMTKLRKKMIVADSDEKMISIVKKSLGDKCISTEQVKSLSALFLSDDGRLNFFSSVYASVNDQNTFLSLETQLIDPNYKKRFRDLIK